jgi:flagellar export protein FliJ
MAPFRLGRVLRLRTQLRRLRMHEAERLGVEMSAIRARAAALATVRERRGQEEARATATGVSAATLQLGRSYDEVLGDDQRRCRAEEDRIETALAAKRAEIETERREERKLEQLETIYRERATEEEAHTSAVILDELALRRYGQARGGRS